MGDNITPKCSDVVSEKIGLLSEVEVDIRLAVRAMGVKLDEIWVTLLHGRTPMMEMSIQVRKERWEEQRNH